MNFSYRFSNLYGVCHKGGNILFTPDGNSLLSSVGNRVNVFDLAGHSSCTMPFETRSSIKRLALSASGRLLITCDENGYALLVNFHSQAVVHRFKFKSVVKCMVFSPDDKYLAVAVGNKIQVWKTPELQKQCLSMMLHRTYTGHHDTVTSIGWSQDGSYFVTGSRDCTARVYSVDSQDDFVVVTLTGHREPLVGTFMLKDQVLPSESKSDVSLRISDDILENEPQVQLSFTESSWVIYTLSSDGAFIVWRWRWLKKPVNETNSITGETSIENLSIHQGEWRRHARYFLQKDNARVRSVAMHSRRADLLVVGFSNGVFSLFEMPSSTHIQSLSISQHELKTCAINCTGEWLALASAKLGQLLVWEWQSETYILKQQGHFHDLSVVAYSSDGRIIATGGDDGKVKLWNAASGFCFVTFTEHSGPITALEFLGEGNAVVSASLDGTVRAFDLVRYRNFKTLTPPSSVQLTCLATDGDGKIICAGAMDPAEIYVWSLQNGKLLDILSGHTGPLSGLSFSSVSPKLASVSWDKTLRIWNPYDSTAPQESFDLGSDGLCVAWRPDGKEVCAGTLKGNLQFWDPEEGAVTQVIDGKRDISGGRRLLDRTTAQNSSYSKLFSSVCYTADGRCVVAGGRSKWVCIYNIGQGILLKKFQISHNRSLDGVQDKLDSKRDGPAGPLDAADVSDSENSDEDFQSASKALPGASRGDSGKRITPPEVRCKSVRFSPTGQAWAAATTEGLLVYSLDSGMLFDPFSVSEDLTPTKIRRYVIDEGEYGQALTGALHLGEQDLIREIYRSVPRSEISLVATSIPAIYLSKILDIVASEFSKTPQFERNLSWTLALLTAHDNLLRSQFSQFLASFRGLQNAIEKHGRQLSNLCNENMYQLAFYSQRPAGDSGAVCENGSEDDKKAMNDGKLFNLVSAVPHTTTS